LYKDKKAKSTSPEIGVEKIQKKIDGRN